MEWLHSLPIATTLLSVAFLRVLLRRWRARGGAHLAWWAFGVFTYGVGTALESTVTLFGNTATLTQAWYIAGAVWGGYPLAQGTVWLLCRPRTARILTAITLLYALTLSALVLLSPLVSEAVEPRRPSGDVIEWQWVRLWSPLLNGYAAIFLIGGAAVSAARYFKLRAPGMREARGRQHLHRGRRAAAWDRRRYGQGRHRRGALRRRTGRPDSDLAGLPLVRAGAARDARYFHRPSTTANSMNWPMW